MYNELRYSTGMTNMKQYCLRYDNWNEKSLVHRQVPTSTVTGLIWNVWKWLGDNKPDMARKHVWYLVCGTEQKYVMGL